MKKEPCQECGADPELHYSDCSQEPKRAPLTGKARYDAYAKLKKDLGR